MELDLLAVFYGVFSAAIITATYIWLTILKRQQRQAMMKAKPFRYFRLRLGR